MKKIFLAVLVLCLPSLAFAADLDIDSDSNDAVDIGSGGTNATSAGAARVTLEAASFVSQANCATITEGFCVDSDDGLLYFYDGDSVESVGAVVSVNTESGAVTLDAGDIDLVDAGSLITGTEVEAALQENRTAINLNTAKVTYPGDAQQHELNILVDATVSTTELNLLDGITTLSGSNTGDAAADDTAYNATSWDSNTDAATKNALRDKIETISAGDTLPAGTDGQFVQYDGDDELVAVDTLTGIGFNALGTHSNLLFDTGVDFISLVFESISIANLDDTTTPSVLTVNESTGKVISNYKSSGSDHVFTLPAAHSHGNVIFQIGDEFQVDVEPYGGTALYLDGTAMATDEHIENDSDTLGERLVCYTANMNGSLAWMCYSSDSNWAEATP